MIRQICALVAVFVAVSFSAVSAKCGPNNFSGLNNSTCYVPGSQFANDWLFASFDCQAKGGNLPSVPNAFVNAHLSSLMRNFTHYQDFKDMWLGGSTNVWPPSFLWTDGSPFDYTNWGSGQPVETQTPCSLGMCIYLNSCVSIQSDDARWYDNACNIRRAYICEVPA